MRCPMAAMKARTGAGPLEVTKEGRGIVMRVPLEGGGRLVVELNADEAGALGEALHQGVGCTPNSSYQDPGRAAAGVLLCLSPLGGLDKVRACCQPRCRPP